ncbi:RNA 2',3'-cyclic phosphodiesterase [Aliiroseovarius subalbicans]|uniref:RNA 2',3'-cyclic phosphodiesterase n=1 Tax=Aliiroseovarius subalbicans TaxID=2925840 RepID=UPI001F5A4B52|nr:RNA 2',3'-cyclic phosphodiesterase [Aliiroseovarius subalbicans]MCI2397936.1 RNA 2',3'-cyclic phosphodiesterase [Aliiroseovarius subalbicans]
MRAFLACPLPEALLAPVTHLQGNLPVGRVVAEENLHLTLCFLGEAEEVDLIALHEQLQELHAPPVTLTLSGLAVYGGKHPTVLAIEGQGPEALQRKLVGLCHSAGIALERRRFRPHVTLARFARNMGAGDRARLDVFIGAHAAIRLEPTRLDNIALYRSDLHPDGARYEVLAEYALRG